MRLKATLQLNSPALKNPEALRPALERVVAETAFEIERDVKEQMRAPKSGRTYSRGVIGVRATTRTRGLGLRERTTAGGVRQAITGHRFHRASAPGEAPAVDQGVLVNSVLAVPRGLRASIGSSVIYAAALEYGVFYSRLRGRRVVRIEPRPAFEPALERAREPFFRRVDETVRGLC